MYTMVFVPIDKWFIYLEILNVQVNIQKGYVV